MDVLTDDHEREQAVKAWWHEYWKPIALGVLIAIGGLLGYRQWQAWQLEKAQTLALELYRAEQVLRAGTDESVTRAEDFVKNHQDLYGALLALRLGSHYGSKGLYDQAVAALDFAAAHGGALVAPAAALAKARVQAQSGKTDEALATLNGLDSEAYQIEKLEATGDIAVIRGDQAAARTAYKAAIELCLSRRVPVMSLLQMKYDNVTQSGDKSAYELSAAHNEDLRRTGEQVR